MFIAVIGSVVVGNSRLGRRDMDATDSGSGTGRRYGGTIKVDGD